MVQNWSVHMTLVIDAKLTWLDLKITFTQLLQLLTNDVSQVVTV